MFNIIIGAGITVALVLAVIGALRISQSTRLHLALTGIGALIGLTLGALLSVSISKLPAPYGTILPIVVTLIVTAISISVAAGSRAFVWRIWLQLRPLSEQGNGVINQHGILVDTSVIIDGRIADIAAAGFVPGRLLIPRFVLAELQNIADSSDAMRRGRGRRGLEVLNALRSNDSVEVEVVEHTLDEIKEVDAKLVRLANQLGAHLLTTDFNLNRVAQIEGVRVLNINELSNAVRPVILPGERMTVKVVQPGKEKGQGVGYLPDGTMIVVDKGDKMIGRDVETEITRVFQTVAGKMLFAAPIGGSTSSAPSITPRVQHEQPVSVPAPAVERPERRARQPRNHSKSPDALSKTIQAPMAAVTQAQGQPSPRRGNEPQARPNNDEQPRPKRSSRRQSPTQRLEDSLLEMNKHDS